MVGGCQLCDVLLSCFPPPRDLVSSDILSDLSPVYGTCRYHFFSHFPPFPSPEAKKLFPD